jgi:hypothetical protein
MPDAGEAGDFSFLTAPKNSTFFISSRIHNHTGFFTLNFFYGQEAENNFHPCAPSRMQNVFQNHKR